jgi:hypothetical protein
MIEEMMHHGEMGQVCGWAVRLVALLAVLALVAGVRPRVLAEEHGSAPAERSICVLCDGGATAATVAPSVDSVALNPSLLTLPAPLGLVVAPVPAQIPPGIASARPPAPPPRA